VSLFRGVYAAVLSPRGENSELDGQSFRQQIAELKTFGFRGYALNGATGEFPIASDADLDLLVHIVREEATDAHILCGVGANDVRSTLKLCKIAQSAGANALLLPMPCFFPYRQDDLIAYVSAVAEEMELPILLYNLPQFTTGLHVETVLSLFEKHSNIAGIKDSSGSLDIVRAITKSGLSRARLIGNDSALSPALAEHLCDGVVSGVACALPELMLALFETNGEGQTFSTKTALLNEFIDHLGALPTPWGLKVTSAVRNFTRESYPFPLSLQRQTEISELRKWFQDWHRQTFRSA